VLPLQPRAKLHNVPDYANKPANTQAYSYDANGNVTDDGVRTYLWDAENRLLQVNLKAQPGVSYQFRYDGFGRRVAIIATNGTATETRYLWCGDTLCQSRTATDTVSRRYYPKGSSVRRQAPVSITARTIWARCATY